MRHLLLLFMLVSLTASAQYDRWAIGAEYGVHAVGDESAIVTDAFNHYGLTARYSINPTVSVGVSGGFDNLTLQNLDGFVGETNYTRISAETFIDIFDVLDLHNNAFTLLIHGGPGYSRIKTSSHRDGVFSLTGGATGLVKVSEDFAITLGARVSSNIGQDMTLDGFKEISNAEINSTVTNFTLGVTFYPSKKGKNKKHADWYVYPEPVYTLNEVNNTYVTREYIRNVAAASCDCIVLEYVFFEHDEHKILQSELNAIHQAFNYLGNNANAELSIKGYASSTKSSDSYNQELSHKRAVEVYNKFEEMGADMNRVSVHAYGKDRNWSDENVHDMARRVELKITKQ